MIRIDLGHDRLEKSAKQSAKTNVDITNAFAPLTKRLKLDLGGVLTLTVGAGFAMLFPLFLQEYERATTAKMQKTRKTLQASLLTVNREIDKLTPFKREMESYNQQKQLASSRLTVVRELLASRNTPVTVLDTLGQHLPKKTWINNVDLFLSEADGTLSVTGSSYSNEEIAEYVEGLTNSVYLREVSLDDVSTRIEEKVEIRSFQLTAKTKDSGLGVRAPAVAPSAPPPTAKTVADAKGTPG